MLWNIFFALTCLSMLAAVLLVRRAWKQHPGPVLLRACLLCGVGLLLGTWLGGPHFSYALSPEIRLVGFPCPVFVLRLEADGSWTDFLKYAPWIVWLSNVGLALSLSLLLAAGITLQSGSS